VHAPDFQWNEVDTAVGGLGKKMSSSEATGLQEKLLGEGGRGVREKKGGSASYSESCSGGDGLTSGGGYSGDGLSGSGGYSSGSSGSSGSGGSSSYED
jgi:hypothetical protein